MLTIEGVDLFGLGGCAYLGAAQAAPSLLDTIQAVIAARSGPRTLSGFGAITTDWDAFVAAGTSATYQDPQKIVYCRKDRVGRPECWLQYSKSPSVDAQKAADKFLNLVKGYHLEGEQIKAQVPDGAGGTREVIQAVPTLVENPIKALGGGYDGIIGAGSLTYTTLALTLAACLKTIPDDAVLAFVAPDAHNVAYQSAGIARFLNDVSANFDALLKAYRDRGMRPATSPLTPETIPQIIWRKPPVAWKKPAALLGGGIAAAACLGALAMAMTKKGERVAEEQDATIFPAF